LDLWAETNKTPHFWIGFSEDCEYLKVWEKFFFLCFGTRNDKCVVVNVHIMACLLVRRNAYHPFGEPSVRFATF
jgi:hypothetical protein